MNRALLLSALGLMTVSAATAQRAFVKAPQTLTGRAIAGAGTVAHKTTGSTDTTYFSNISSAATPYMYSYNPTASYYGTISGTSSDNMQGFAERYDVAPGDSSVKVIGVLPWFSGVYSSSSSKTVSFSVWQQGSPEVYGNIIYNGFPTTTPLAQLSGIPVSSLGIGTSVDTPKTFWFPTATGYLTDSFFIGYQMTYSASSLSGDTLGLVTTTAGDRTSAPYTVSGTDTLVNVQNAVQYTDGYWYDLYFDYTGLAIDYYIYPVVQLGSTTDVKGITRKNFTLYGNYPNPATTETTVRYALQTADDITVAVTDINGRTISTTTEKGLAAGDHTTTINAAALSAGSYIYLIRTASGAGIASKFTVAK